MGTDETRQAPIPGRNGNGTLTPMAKGHNPPGAGRPKGMPNLKTVLAKVLSQKTKVKSEITGEQEEQTVLEQMLEKLAINGTLAGDVASVRELLDRAYGKPTQYLGNDPDSPLTETSGARQYTKEELRDLLNKPDDIEGTTTEGTGNGTLP